MDVSAVFLSIGQYLVTGFIGWVAYELRQLRKEVSARVHEDDCKDDMQRHCSRIDAVEKTATENAKSIAVINNTLGI